MHSSDILGWLTIFALIVLFAGEPDLHDKLLTAADNFNNACAIGAEK